MISIIRTLTAFAALLCIVSLHFLPAYAGDDFRQIEKEMKARYEGTVLTLREFWRSDWLRYSAEGKLLDRATKGPWTLFGKIVVQKLDLDPEKLQIRGKRIFVLYEDKGRTLKYVGTPMRVRIEIRLPGGQSKKDIVYNALNKVFLSRNDRLADMVPAYWRRFLLRKGKSESEKQTGSLSGNKTKASPKDKPKRIPIPAQLIQEARLIHRVTPTYPRLALRAKIQGTVRLKCVVGKDGTIKDLQIIEPRGAGLDDAAAEAISQWKYEPSVVKGEPVEVVAFIPVHFRLQ